MRKSKHVSRKQAISIFRSMWMKLTETEREARVRSLEALRLMRDGRSLSSASRSIGLDLRTAKEHLGTYIYKRKRRWRPRKIDRIERGLTIYEYGQSRPVHIFTRDSDSASVVGQYFNDVKKALVSGDESILKKYKKVTIESSDGKRHRLETRLDRLRDIELGRENLDFPDVYDYAY